MKCHWTQSTDTYTIASMRSSIFNQQFLWAYALVLKANSYRTILFKYYSKWRSWCVIFYYFLISNIMKCWVPQKFSSNADTERSMSKPCSCFQANQIFPFSLRRETFLNAIISAIVSQSHDVNPPIKKIYPGNTQLQVKYHTRWDDLKKIVKVLIFTKKCSLISKLYMVRVVIQFKKQGVRSNDYIWKMFFLETWTSQKNFMLHFKK